MNREEKEKCFIKILKIEGERNMKIDFSSTRGKPKVISLQGFLVTESLVLAWNPENQFHLPKLVLFGGSHGNRLKLGTVFKKKKGSPKDR